MRIPMVLVMGGAGWFLSVVMAIAGGQYQLACEIFLYGALAGWAALVLWGGVLEKARQQALAELRVPSLSPTSRASASHRPLWRLAGFVIASTGAVGLILGCLATGQVLGAGAVALAAAAGAAAAILAREL